jgi:hypothetical protein
MMAQSTRETGTARGPSRVGRLQTIVGLLLILTGIAGLAYPLLLTAVAHLTAARQARDSLEGPGGAPRGQTLPAPTPLVPAAARPPGGSPRPHTSRAPVPLGPGDGRCRLTYPFTALKRGPDLGVPASLS